MPSEQAVLSFCYDFCAASHYKDLITAMAGRDKQTNRPADELQACDGEFDKYVSLPCRHMHSAKQNKTLRLAD